MEKGKKGEGENDGRMIRKEEVWKKGKNWKGDEDEREGDKR